MRIYVAGASVEVDRIEQYIAQIRAAGHEITFDWCAQLRRDPKPDAAERRRLALACQIGVRAADAVWFVGPAPTSRSTGSWVELGIALDGCVPLIVSGAVGEDCIFVERCFWIYEHHDQALEFLCGSMAKT